MEEDWDKTDGGVCVVESIPLPMTLLNIINNDKLFRPNIKYNCIFRCGGITADTFEECYEFTVIIYKNDSKLLTKVDERITQRLKECSSDTDLIVDSLNSYQVQLPNIKLPKHDQDEESNTKCNCVWSKQYGLIAVFKGKSFYITTTFYFILSDSYTII